MNAGPAPLWESKNLAIRPACADEKDEVKLWTESPIIHKAAGDTCGKKD
jgi:hypothetical protein